MILLVHIIFGVAVASLFKNPYLAILMAFLSHYFLDFFPHIEYDIEEIKDKDWKKSGPAFFRVFVDFIIGISLVFLFSNNQLIFYIYAFFAILPDGLSILNEIFLNKFLNFHDFLHLKKIHFLKNDKRISNFWRVATQVVAVIIAIIILK